eukprot:8862133-Pyramimonas_sp.AAC.1
MSRRQSSLCRETRTNCSFATMCSPPPLRWPRDRSGRASASQPWGAPGDWAHAATGRSRERRRQATA